MKGLKLALITCLLSFSMTGFAGIFDDMFSSNYDPYYGYDKVQSPDCYRPCVETLDRCDCKRNLDECKCVQSTTTFERKYKDAPYSPMSNYYVNVFDGWF